MATASCLMRRDWEPEELIACWTLADAIGVWLTNKIVRHGFGFAERLKFFALEGRYPRHASEPPPAAVEYVAAQVDVDAAGGWRGLRRRDVDAGALAAYSKHRHNGLLNLQEVMTSQANRRVRTYLY